MAGTDANEPRHIVLIGMRGCGKTTVGRLVARALDRPHVDTDQLVAERAGMTIAEVFGAVGEVGFRKLERDAVAAAVAGDGRVISVGGGAVLDAENVTVLRERGRTVWLTASPAELYGRMQTDGGTVASRPPLSDLPGLAEVAELLRLRAASYRAAADVEIDTAGRAPDAIARAVVAALGLSCG